jgi:hypothetical protein
VNAFHLKPFDVLWQTLLKRNNSTNYLRTGFSCRMELRTYSAVLISIDISRSFSFIVRFYGLRGGT